MRDHVFCEPRAIDILDLHCLRGQAYHPVYSAYTAVVYVRLVLKAPSCIRPVDKHRDKGRKGLNTAFHAVAAFPACEAVKARQAQPRLLIAVLHNRRERSARKSSE